MIPSLLHWVWPHDASLTETETALASWREHHPAWRALLWTSAPQDVAASLLDLDFEVRALPLLVNHRLYSLLGCHSERAGAADFPHQARATVAGIEIVARHGGVCVPMDQGCEGNIESLLRDVRLFTRESGSQVGDENWTATLPTSPPLYGASANHPALWNMVRDLKNSVALPHACPDALCATSLVELLQFRLGRHPDLVTFPFAAFEEARCSTL